MDVGLGWLGVGVGAVGFIVTYLLAAASVSRNDLHVDGNERRKAWLIAGIVLAATLIFWLISMMKREPFSLGQSLGLGFLMGGITGAAACILSFRFDALTATAGSVRTWYLTAHSMAFWSLFGVSLTYLIFRGNPQDALMGFAIGVAMAAILRSLVQGLRPLVCDTHIQVWSIFAITIAAGIIFAVNHFDETTLRMWWPLPILMATTICVCGYIGTEIGSSRSLNTRPGASYALSALVGSVLVIGLSAIYSWRIVTDWQLLIVTAVGVAIAALIAWLAAGSVRDNTQPGALDTASLSVLLVAGLFVATFRIWSGFGAVLGLLAAWPIILPSLALRRDLREQVDYVAGEPAAVPKSLITAAIFGLAIVLFRLFIELYRSDLGTADLRIHYTFVGAILGVVFPFVLASSFFRLRNDGDPRANRADFPLTAGVILLGLIAAASPLALFMIWQIKAVMGLLFGFVAAEAILYLLLLLQLTLPLDWRQKSIADSTMGLLIIGAELIALQFIRPLLLVEVTRATQIWALVIAAGIVICWIVLSGFIARRTAR